MHARSRGKLRTAVMPRHFSKKMATLSLGGPAGELERSFGDYQGRHVEAPLAIKERSTQGMIIINRCADALPGASYLQ